MRRDSLLRAVAVWVLVACALAVAPTARGERAGVTPPPEVRWGPSISVAPRPELSGRHNAVAFLGDSLTYDAWVGGQLLSRLRDGGWRLSGFLGQGGILLPELTDRIAAWVAFLPRTVVVGAGSNDVYWGGDAAAFRRDVQALLRLLGRQRRVVWVNIYAGCEPGCLVRSQQFNEVLRRIDRRRPNLAVADWYGLLARSPELLRTDDASRMHAGAEGAARRVELMLASAAWLVLARPDRRMAHQPRARHSAR